MKLYSASTWLLVLAASIASGFFYYFAYSGKEVFNGCEVKDQQGNEHECRIVLKTWQKIVYTVITVVVLLIFICTYRHFPLLIVTAIADNRVPGFYRHCVCHWPLR